MAFRELEILLELIRVKKTTARELASKFEVSTKTISRDLDRLSSAGFPIRCERGRDGGVLIDPAFKIDRSAFTPDDVSDITLGMHLLAGIRGKRRSASVMAKLAMTLPELTQSRQADLDRYLAVDIPAMDLDENAAFRTLNDALDKEVRVRVHLDGGNCTVAPLGYVLGTSGLALHCHDDRAGYRTIPLCDIVSCLPTELEFDRDEYLDYRAANRVRAIPRQRLDESTE